MISALISRIVIMLLGVLYPAYGSFKAIRNKNVKEYVKYMMYWIIYAIFSFCEALTDIFVSWFPFYYELKLLIVIWLISPHTNGSAFIYKKFVHPTLTRNESEIDEFINDAKNQGYNKIIEIGTRGISYASNVIVQTATKTLPNSISEYALSAQQVTEGSVRRSQSADFVDRAGRSMPDISSDENVEIDCARIRDPPKRKTARAVKPVKRRTTRKDSSKNIDVC